MKKISIETYNLFLIHGSELLWISDSMRFPRPNGITEEIDRNFIILERVDHNLEMIATGLYNEKMTNEFLNIVKKNKNLISDEVFEKMKNKYNEIEKQNGIFKSVQN